MVGADGANSQVRKLGGFGSWGWGYGQEAVVCTVKVTPRDTVKRPEGGVTHTHTHTHTPSLPHTGSAFDCSI